MTDYPPDIRDAAERIFNSATSAIEHAANIGAGIIAAEDCIASALLAERTVSAEIARTEAAHRGAGFGDWLYQKIMEGKNG